MKRATVLTQAGCLILSFSLAGCIITRRPDIDATTARSEHVEKSDELRSGNAAPERTEARSDSEMRDQRADDMKNAKKSMQGIMERLKDELRFDVGSADLKSGARDALDELAGMLKGDSSAKLKLEGFADSTGSSSFNKALSMKRAEAVRKELMSRGVKASQLQARGYGESRPVASNANDDGRAKNRRVEIRPRG